MSNGVKPSGRTNRSNQMVSSESKMSPVAPRSGTGNRQPPQYSRRERSEQAKRQPRDRTGQFAPVHGMKAGERDLMPKPGGSKNAVGRQKAVQAVSRGLLGKLASGVMHIGTRWKRARARHQALNGPERTRWQAKLKTYRGLSTLMDQWDEEDHAQWSERSLASWQDTMHRKVDLFYELLEVGLV
jgi:hypothetical protein